MHIEVGHLCVNCDDWKEFITNEMNLNRTNDRPQKKYPYGNVQLTTVVFVNTEMSSESYGIRYTFT